MQASAPSMEGMETFTDDDGFVTTVFSSIEPMSNEDVVKDLKRQARQVEEKLRRLEQPPE